MRIGLISDTHGLLRPEALHALAGVKEIIHAGDVGASEIIGELGRIAPVHAVRGNNDRGPWARKLPPRLELRLGGSRILVLHDLEELGLDAQEHRVDVIVSGHSHKPGVIQRDGTLHVNPGSAGPRRFKLPVTVGYLILADGAARAEIRNLI